jgi:hypothetical protein
MHSVINIKQLTLKLTNLALSQLFLREKMENKLKWMFINIKEREESEWECIILMKVLKSSPIAHSNML